MPKLLEHAVEIKKLFEKCKLTAYQDSGFIWTIGWGHTSDSFFRVHEGMVITQEKADELLWHDLGEAETLVKKDILIDLLNDYQYSALVDIVYNSGRLLRRVAGAWKPSDLMIAINSNELEKAGEMIKTFKIRDASGKELLGLKRRRMAAYLLWKLDEHTQILAKDWAQMAYNQIYKMKL